MKVEFRLLNCFLLVLPLLVWNMLLAPRITDSRITSDAHSPAWLLIAENVSRMAVFALPLLFPLRMKDLPGRAGLLAFLLGSLIYFASWLPLLLAPGSVWSNSAAGLLAPRLTPLLALLGIALIGHAWPYGVLVGVFVLLHTWHGLQNL